MLNNANSDSVNVDKRRNKVNIKRNECLNEKRCHIKCRRVGLSPVVDDGGGIGVGSDACGEPDFG